MQASRALWANSEFARKLKVLQAEGFAHELGVLWASSELCAQTCSFAGELHASLAISELRRQAQSFSGELSLVGESSALEFKVLHANLESLAGELGVS